MAAFWSRKRIVVAALLALLVIAGASAAVWFSPERTVRDARVAIDRAELDRADRIIDWTLAFHGWRDVEDVWMLRTMRGEVLFSRGERTAAECALKFELPAAHSQSETAVQHLLLTGKREKALAIAQTHQPHLLSDVYRVLARDNPSQRERYAREAIALAQKDGRPATEAKAWTVLGFHYVDQGRYQDAIDAFARAEKIATDKGFPLILQNTYGNLGWAYTELGDYERAEELFREAQKRANRIGAKHEEVPWLIQLAAMSHLKRNYNEAIRYTQRALKVDPARQAGFAYGNLASAAFELGNYEKAREWNEKAREAKREETGPEKTTDDLLRSDILGARIVARRDVKRAEAQLRDVIRKAAEASTRWEAEARLAEVYAQAGNVSEASKFYAAAFASARKARNSITGQELRFAFFNLIDEILDRYVDFLVANGRIDEAFAVVENSRAESLKSDSSPPANFDAPAIAKAHDAIILSYWLGRERSYLFAARPDGVTLHDLGAIDTTIEKQVDAHQKAVMDSQDAQPTARKLYSMLVAPARVPAGSRVMIVADGALHTLSFETLQPAPGRWWIEDVTVGYAGGLQLLARVGAARPAREPSILVVGDPPENGEHRKLEHAAEEIQAITKRFPRHQVLREAAATPAAYDKVSAATFDYIHFAAHGVASRKVPLDSAIILAKDPETQNYRLFARDIVEKPLTAKLVTISSCESAGTRTYAGEGVVGLAWAFQKAGADQVVASLWKASDQATATLMDRMYDGIRDGQDVADALRAAKLTLIRSGYAQRHPRYWAPFVLYSGN